MIALLGASAIVLTAMQAGITAPTNEFRTCLKEASAKATTEKVAPDAIEAYLRNACTAQLDKLRSALIAFSVKNGTSRKTAAADADMTVNDYLATPVDKYQFMASQNAAQPPANPQPTPAAAPQPPKQ